MFYLYVIDKEYYIVRAMSHFDVRTIVAIAVNRKYVKHKLI